MTRTAPASIPAYAVDMFECDHEESTIDALGETMQCDACGAVCDLD
jgi:hypothetical protein